jgi:PPP family 3-phenylpropionic acid transporter
MKFDWFRSKTFEYTLRGAVYYWVFCFGFSSYDTFINLYFAQIGYSSLQIGLLAAAVCTVLFFAAPLISSLGDRWNQRKIVLGAALALMAIALVILGFPTGFLPVFLLYTLTAVFRAPVSPLADSLATEMEKHNRSSFTTMRAIGSLGGGMAAIGFGFLWALIGFETMFLIGGLLLFLAALATQLLVEYPSLKKHDNPLNYKDVLQNRTLIFVWVSSIPVWVALFMSWTFEGIYVQSLGGTAALIGLIRGLAILVEVPAMIFSGKLLKKANSVEILYGAVFLLAATHFVYALIPNPNWLLWISILKGIGVGFLITSLVRAIADQAPSEYASSYQSVTSALTWGFSALVGSLLGGFVFDGLGGRTMFALCAVLTAAAVLVLYYFLNRHGQTIQAAAATYEVIPLPDPEQRFMQRSPELFAISDTRSTPKISREEEEEIIIETLERRYSRMLDED